MEIKEAMETLKHQLACEKEEDCINDYCEQCPHNVSDADFIEALTIAISALENIETEDGRRLWCGQDRTDIYRPYQEEE